MEKILAKEDTHRDLSPTHTNSSKQEERLRAYLTSTEPSWQEARLSFL